MRIGFPMSRLWSKTRNLSSFKANFRYHRRLCITPSMRTKLFFVTEGFLCFCTKCEILFVTKFLYFCSEFSEKLKMLILIEITLISFAVNFGVLIFLNFFEPKILFSIWILFFSITAYFCLIFLQLQITPYYRS